MRETSLPGGIWCRPSPDTQPRLFHVSVTEGLAELRVSRDEVRRWQQQGWISFDIQAMIQLEDQDRWEIEFVRDIARSGLSDSQIEELFVNLPKPYRFNPICVAYHFGFGWVKVHRDDPFNVVEENVIEWIERFDDQNDLHQLNEIRDKITEQIKAIEECYQDNTVE